MKLSKSSTTRFVTLLALSLLLGNDPRSFAQTRVRSLKIGDRVPDIEIGGIINSPNTALKFSEFKDKLLILDFWATWCGPCVSSFPKLDSLQRKIGSRIKLLPVTSENKELVSAFLKKMQSVKHLLPETATEDVILAKLFKHTVLPHYVWINNGTVVAITERKDLTEYNIEKILQGQIVKLPEKNDANYNIVYSNTDATSYAPSMLLKKEKDTVLVRIPDSSLVCYSSMTKYIEGKPRGWASRKPELFTADNLSVIELYRVALLENTTRALNFYNNGIVIDIADTTVVDEIEPWRKKIQPGLQFEEWIRPRGYCYEIKVSNYDISNKFKIMLSDLNRYFGAKFGIEGLIEERPSKYLALIRTNAEDKLLSKGGPPVVQADKFSIKIQNKKMNVFVGSLAQPLQKQPFIVDETNYQNAIDLTLYCDLTDLAAVNKELLKYGLQLQEREKLFETPVIRMKRN